MQDALRGGVVGYLTKPFRVDDLRTRLREFANRRERLAATSTLRQVDIDLMTGALSLGPRPTSGVNDETADAVAHALRSAGESGALASDIAETVGISRVTARKYLEWLVAAGTVAVRSEYGATGRPPRRYRLTAG